MVARARLEYHGFPVSYMMNGVLRKRTVCVLTVGVKMEEDSLDCVLTAKDEVMEGENWSYLEGKVPFRRDSLGGTFPIFEV